MEDLLNNRLLLGVIVVVIVPLIICGYVIVVERVLGRLTSATATRIRPWLWVLPAVAFVSVFLIYPAIATIVRSFFSRDGETATFDNYTWLFGRSENLIAIRNNIIWALLLPLLVIGIGLAVAVMADRVRYEVAVRSVIFMPMAISSVAAGVIWRLMYDIDPKAGTLNAVRGALDQEPAAYLSTEPWNNLSLIIVAVWMMTGLAVVVIASGLKGIPQELLEAGRIDGAGEVRIFRHIILPLLSPTIAVVTTTVLIFALKTFDIVYVMTNGNFGTEVIANQMYKQLFAYTQHGRSAAVATLLFLITIPVMAVQVRRFRAQEETR